MNNLDRVRHYAGAAATLALLTAFAVVTGGCPDVTPPGNVSGLTAEGGDSQINLAWTNPADADFFGVKIQRKQGSYPTGPSDGATVFDGRGSAYLDTTAVNGTTYYYTAYAYDMQLNYASGAQAMGVATVASAEIAVLAAARDLATEIRGLGSDIPETTREVLLASLEEADQAYRGGDTCGAGEALAPYFEGTQGLRTSARELGEMLFNEGRMLRYNMLAGLLMKDACPGAERVGLEVDATTPVQDNEGFSAEGLFGEPKLMTVKAGDDTFTQLEIPGADSALGEPGAPAIPIVRRLIAVPIGSGAPTIEDSFEVGETFKCNPVPVQAQPVDAPPESDFANPPFEGPNPDLYGSGAGLYPAKIVSDPVALGSVRGLQLYQVEIASGQFNPATSELTLFKNVMFDAKFTGRSTGVFVREAATTPFEDGASVYGGAVLNKESVFGYVSPSAFGNLTYYLGEEFIIFVTPALKDAADTLATWKRAKGITTRVVQCGAGTDFPTGDSIRAYIKNQYDNNIIRPSYILLLGDAELIPCYYLNSIGTDWPYAVMGTPSTATAPDFAVGRIPVDTLAQANTVVTKIINYEKTPPFNVSFYSNATIAAQFQCCRNDVGTAGTDQRTFIEVSEFCRNVLLGKGKTVQRIYTKTGPSTTPARYYDGTPLPGALGPGSGFTWSGSTADISAAWNAGRFLMIHRDHGWQEGWVHPVFENPNVDAVTNGSLLPVVFSVNCASGFFDNETAGGAYGTSVGGVYFVERALRKADGGAVGVLGDSRNSPSWPNSALLRGFMDAMYPSAIPSFGDATTHRRLGDILNHGKLYMWSQYAGTGDGRDELYLWHCFGDPTMQIWLSNPNIIKFPIKVVAKYLTAGLSISCPIEGAVVTVFQQNPTGGGLLTYGRGTSSGGAAILPFLNCNAQPNPKLPLLATFEHPEAVSTQVAIGEGAVAAK